MTGGSSERKDVLLASINLPTPKQSASRKGKEKAETSVSSESDEASKKSRQLEELPAGHVGEMLILYGYEGLFEKLWVD
ncbi:hypothetical protein V6N13_132571 [Hibiscus sabdariffa]